MNVSEENFSVERRQDGSLAIRFGIGVDQERRRRRGRGHDRGARKGRPLPRHRGLLQARRPHIRQQPRPRAPRQGGRASTPRRPRHARHQRRTHRWALPSANATCARAARPPCSTSSAARWIRRCPRSNSKRARPPRGHARLGEGAPRRLRLGAPLQGRRRRTRPLHHPLRSPTSRWRWSARSRRSPGMVTRVQARTTRDGRKFYIVDLEDLSGTVELTVWNDTLELTGEACWAEGPVLLVSVELRDRGDRLSLNVRKAAPYDSERRRPSSASRPSSGRWRRRSRAAIPATQRERATQRPRHDAQPTAPPPTATQRRHRRTPAATSEPPAPGVQPPVSGDAARLVVTTLRNRRRARR